MVTYLKLYKLGRWASFNIFSLLHLGKLIVNPSRGSVRGVRGVVETSVDTYDEDSHAAVTPQGVRLAEGINNEQQDNFGSNECIASPMYFAQNNRAKSKDRNSSTNESTIGDVCL